MKPHRPRVLWLAGTRGEVLRLAPYSLHLMNQDPPGERLHWFAMTGEQGMAAYQALDECRMRPHAEVELRHPAEDPAARLQGLLGEIESLARRFRATHLVFTGVGPTAAAGALVCHGRNINGVWIPPLDNAALIPRLRWERGLEGVIRSLGESIEILDPPPIRMGATIKESGEQPRGGSPGSPLAILAVARPAWGSGNLPERLARAAAHWADSMPEFDWLFLRSLDARFEGPFQAMRDRPANLLSAPPVPYAVVAPWMREAGVIMTDSWAIASEALALGTPVACLGEDAAEASGHAEDRLLSITAADIGENRLGAFLKSALGRSPTQDFPALLWAFDEDVTEKLKAALAGG